MYNIHRPDPDPKRPRYVIMRNDGLSVLMVPFGKGGAPIVWWSYQKSEAELMLKILEKDFNMRGTIMEYRQAIVILSNKHAELAQKLKQNEE